MMYSKASIAEFAHRQGKSEDQIQRILAGLDRLKQLGLVKTSGGGTNVGLTAEGRRTLTDLRARGAIPAR